MKSYLPFLVILGVGVLAMLMRMFSSSSNASTAPPTATKPDGDEDADGYAQGAVDDEESDDPDAIVPITAEGVAFIHDTHALRLLRLMEPESDPPDWLQNAMNASAVPYSILNRLYYPGAGGGLAVKPGASLGAGDFTAARITPGVAGSYAWRLETLGRDGDFGFFPFTSRSGAESALELLERYGIVRRQEDEHGQPIPASPEDFEEARRRYEETEQALAIDTDDDEPPRESPSVSDRR